MRHYMSDAGFVEVFGQIVKSAENVCGSVPECYYVFFKRHFGAESNAKILDLLRPRNTLAVESDLVV